MISVSTGELNPLAALAAFPGTAAQVKPFRVIRDPGAILKHSVNLVILVPIWWEHLWMVENASSP